MNDGDASGIMTLDLEATGSNCSNAAEPYQSAQAKKEIARIELS